MLGKLLIYVSLVNKFLYKYPYFSEDIPSVSHKVLNVRNDSIESLRILNILKKLYLDVYICNRLLYSLPIYIYQQVLLLFLVFIISGTLCCGYFQLQPIVSLSFSLCFSCKFHFAIFSFYCFSVWNFRLCLLIS